jgi:arylsulfatase A-like enzyme
VVVGDNGDQLDGNERVPGTGKNTLFDAGSAVPLVIAGPGVRAPGPSDALVSVVDLFPTFAAFAGIDVGGLRSITDPARPLALDGVSLRDNLRDADTPVHDTIAFMRFAPNGPPPLQMGASIRSTTHKLVTNGQRERLYRYRPGAADEGQPIEDPAGEDLEALVALREQLARTVDVGNYDRR